VRILQNDGPLRVEEHETMVVIIHKATGERVGEHQFVRHNLVSTEMARAYWRGFCAGWKARKQMQHRGDEE
jgi:hypothetical protein